MHMKERLIIYFKKVIHFIWIPYNQSRLNIIATVIINFSNLTFRNALKFPILVYGETVISCKKGKIYINSPIKTGMIIIGKYGRGRSVRKSVFINQGIINIGGNILFTKGFRCYNYGILSIGSHVYIGEDSTIMCSKNIQISSFVRTSWNFFAQDSDGHYYLDLCNNRIKDMYGLISIGAYTWIGNNVTIKKHTIITPYTIVASLSLLTKDYSKFGNFCLLGGSPAGVLKEQVCPILNLQIEDELKKENWSNAFINYNSKDLDLLTQRNVDFIPFS